VNKIYAPCASDFDLGKVKEEGLFAARRKNRRARRLRRVGTAPPSTPQARRSDAASTMTTDSGLGGSTLGL